MFNAHNLFKSCISLTIALSFLISSSTIALADEGTIDFSAVESTVQNEADVQIFQEDTEIVSAADETESSMTQSDDFAANESLTEANAESPAEETTSVPEENSAEPPAEKPVEDSFEIKLSESEFIYNGKEQKPSVSIVNQDGRELENKKDYTISFSDSESVNAGTYTVTIQYIGSYSGTYDVEYKILPRETARASASKAVFTNNGKVQKPSVTVKDDLGNTLVNNRDYTLIYSDKNSKKSGAYTISVKMQGNYKNTKTLKYYIIDGKITLSATRFTYNGAVLRPSVTVTDKNGKKLTNKKDYTVSYSNANSVNAGSYKVTVKFIGQYSGVANYLYKILPQTNVTPQLSRVDIRKTGTVQRPTVTIRDCNNVLTYKKDFTVDYSDWNSVNEGVYTVTVNLMGNYSGSHTYKYYINDANYLPINISSTHISHEYSNVKKEIFGKSVQGRNLEAFVITPTNGRYTKTFVMTFAIHGFEDSYSRDGQVLTTEGNNLVEYYAKNPQMLKNYRLVIIPCLNPDGTIAGVNNQRACSTAFGRCTANHIDMNRDFSPFKAIESRYFRDFLNKYRPDVFTDFHGWFDEVLGTGSLCNIYGKNMNLSTKKIDRFAASSGYLHGYVNKTYRCPSALVEYKSPNQVSHKQTYSAINEIINYYK